MAEKCEIVGNLIRPVRLKQIAAHNFFLRDFIDAYNSTASSSQKVYNLSSRADVSFLNSEGYGVSVSFDFVQAVITPETRRWIDDCLTARRIDYIRSVSESMELGSGLVRVVSPSCEPQFGICVVGSNNEVHESEVHRVGREGIVPLDGLDFLTVVTKGPRLNRVGAEAGIDLATARLVYMPAGNGKVYLFDGIEVDKQGGFFDPKGVGHYAPHIFAVAGILLPRGTNVELLDPLEREYNDVHGVRFTARDKVLASDRGTSGTTLRVVGETHAKKVLEELQAQSMALRRQLGLFA